MSLFQELVLSIIPSFAHMIEYTSLKHSIIPRVKNLVLKTSNLSVSKCRIVQIFYTEFRHLCEYILA